MGVATVPKFPPGPIENRYSKQRPSIIACTFSAREPGFGDSRSSEAMVVFQATRVMPGRWDSHRGPDVHGPVVRPYSNFQTSGSLSVLINKPEDPITSRWDRVEDGGISWGIVLLFGRSRCWAWIFDMDKTDKGEKDLKELKLALADAIMITSLYTQYLILWSGSSLSREIDEASTPRRIWSPRRRIGGLNHKTNNVLRFLSFLTFSILFHTFLSGLLPARPLSDICIVYGAACLPADLFTCYMSCLRVLPTCLSSFLLPDYLLSFFSASLLLKGFT